MIRRTVLFSGRVQGVGFRYTACAVARGFEVSGYVRNLADGRVEAVIEGREEEVGRFVQALSDEMASCIREMESQDSSASSEFNRFEIRF